MTFALGSLAWTPKTFWDATFYEISCAYVGHCEANGIPPYGSNGKSLTDTELEVFRENVERMKERYPDGQSSEADWKAVKKALGK